jgi:hypothetical protein
VLAASVTACGGGADPAPEQTEPGQTSTSDTTSSEPTSTSPSAPTTATTDADYLPVPEGRVLTEPGTEFGLRERGLVAWKPRQDVVGVVGISVLRIERTTVAASLQGYRLDAAAAASTPYFVTIEVGNGGDTDLGGRQLPMYVVDSADRLVAPTGIDQAFEPCPRSTLPAVFAPGDATRSCLIFLVPPGATLEQVMFRPPEGVVPITWAGKVRRLEDRGGRKGTARGRRGSG